MPSPLLVGPFNKYSACTYYVTGMLTDTVDGTVSKTNDVSSPWS